MVQKKREQILDVTQEDIRALADILESILKQVLSVSLEMNSRSKQIKHVQRSERTVSLIHKQYFMSTYILNRRKEWKITNRKNQVL